MNYGNNLKRIREEYNISQDNMANILGIQRSTYGHYETQYQIIPIKHLISFCDYFNVSLDYVLDLNNKKNYNFVNSKNSGLRLKEIRKQNNLTQEKLANLLNTTKGVICDYEKERYLIATPFLYDICKRFDISADYLLGRIDEPKYLK